MAHLVIGTANPKGGTGKTTVAVHLAVAAHREGYGVSLLDTDPQGSALDWNRRSSEGYDGPPVERVSRERTLAAAVQQSKSDVVVIDSPARLDESTGRVLSVSDIALVPVRPSGLDLWGTVEFLELVETHVDEKGLTAAFVRSQADLRTNLTSQLSEALSRLGLPLLDGLTRRVAYARSMSEGRTVLDGSDSAAKEEVRDLLSDVGSLPE